MILHKGQVQKTYLLEFQIGVIEMFKTIICVQQNRLVLIW